MTLLGETFPQKVSPRQHNERLLELITLSGKPKIPISFVTCAYLMVYSNLNELNIGCWNLCTWLAELAEFLLALSLSRSLSEHMNVIKWFNHMALLRFPNVIWPDGSNSAYLVTHSISISNDCLFVHQRGAIWALVHYFCHIEVVIIHCGGHAQKCILQWDMINGNIPYPHVKTMWETRLDSITERKALYFNVRTSMNRQGVRTPRNTICCILNMSASCNATWKMFWTDETKVRRIVRMVQKAYHHQGIVPNDPGLLPHLSAWIICLVQGENEFPIC